MAANPTTPKPLKQQYEEWIDRMKAQGVKMLTFQCPKCQGEIEDRAANPGQIWDTLASCPHCGAMYFKVATDSKITATVPEGY